MDDALHIQDLMRALNGWAAAPSRGVRSAGGPDGFEFIQLHTRPDPQAPEVQLTFGAELVDSRPRIVVSRSPAPGSTSPRRETPEGAVSVVSVVVGDDASAESHGRDPAARCEACDAVGTVGRAARTDGAGMVTEMHRFCADCWPEQSARYKARWADEDRRAQDDFLRGRAPASGAGPGTWFESATWHGTLELVRHIESSMIAPLPPRADSLAQLAEEIRSLAAELEGEMPLEVERFVQRYGAS